jgi:hypothetical protein
MIFYLTYNSVPELKVLSPAKRIEVIRAAGRAFGRTPQFWRIWWFTIFISFGSGFGAALLVLFAFHGSSASACGAFTVCLLIGYTIAFHVRMHYLRPHIRDYLSQPPNNAA